MLYCLFFRKEKMKNVFAHSSSRYFDIKTIDDNIKDVWIIAPIPISENGERFGYEIDENDEKYSLDVGNDTGLGIGVGVI